MVFIFIFTLDRISSFRVLSLTYESGIFGRFVGGVNIGGVEGVIGNFVRYYFIFDIDEED